MNDNLLLAICKNTFIIAKLPHSKRSAVSTRDIGIKHAIPTTTIYRRLKPLIEWDNLISFKKPRHGRHEAYFYLKNNFSLLFENRKISIVYHDNKGKNLS